MPFTLLPKITRNFGCHTKKSFQNNIFQQQQKYQKRSSSSSSILLFHNLRKGDLIKLKNDNDNKIKKVYVIKEKRGNGWYSIQLLKDSNDNNDNKIIKRRISDIMPLSTTDITNTTLDPKNRNTVTAPTVTISKKQKETKEPYVINLDELLLQSNIKNNNVITSSQQEKEYINQINHLSKITKWITFTDLHVCPSTLPTCLKVLQKVHDVGCSLQQCNDDNVGILFLGDFWHHRGVVRIDCLNCILEELKNWTLPCIFIPGNHDQVTWSGDSHGLTPLQNAYRINNNTIPGPLILTYPTIINNALLVPHVRDISSLQSIVTSKYALEANALFVHADVTGAYMNDLITSKGGISPKHFPSNKHIYSGHFHKSHIVKTKDNKNGDLIQIDYIGSPYQVSLSEAGQSKFLYVLDKNWKCIDKQILNIGKKHYKYNKMHDFLNNIDDNNTIKNGDRVVITFDPQELYNTRNNNDSTTETTISNPFDEKVNRLRKNGVQVELREITSSSEFTANGNTKEEEINIEKEDLTPQATLLSYLNHEVNVRNKSIDTNIFKQLEKGGLILIDEILSSSNADNDTTTSTTNNDKSSSVMMNNNDGTDFILESISLQGFGSFQNEVTYPLNNRGLVLLRGLNKESSGFDSNGSGKSTLVVSILWAITGQIDSRPLDDFKVSDVINDYCKMAKVSLHGKINNKKFIIVRTKTASKSILTFNYNNQDLTRQSVKETQQIINEILSGGGGNSNGIKNIQMIISRTFFHGQHHTMNGLLESTDVKLKDELSNIVPISLWQDATTLARKKSRMLTQQINEFNGKLSMRESDYEIINRKHIDAKNNYDFKCNELHALENNTKLDLEKYNSLIRNESKIYDSIQSYQTLIDDMNVNVIDLERQKEKLQMDKMMDVRVIQDDLNNNTIIFNSLQKDIIICQNDIHKITKIISNATEYYDTTLSKWGVEKLSFSDSTRESAIIDEKIHIPNTCPTCNQKIDDPINSKEDDKHNSYHSLKVFIKNDIASANELVQSATLEKENFITTLDTLFSKRNTIQNITNEYKNKIHILENKWNGEILCIENEILDLRNSLQSKTTQMSNLAIQIQKISNYRSQKSDTESAIQRKRDDASNAKSSYEVICQERDTTCKSIEKLKVERDATNQQLFIMNQLSDTLGARGIQSYILENAITSLKLSTQSYLDILSDGSQKLEMCLDSSDRISRIASIRSSNGEWNVRPLSSLSGGQWRRCSLSFQLGFSDLIAKRGRFTSSLLILDEPLTHLDTAGRAYVGQVLKRFLLNNNNINDSTTTSSSSSISALKYSTIIVILQDLVAQELEDIFDSIDEVVKSDGRSIVNVDAGDNAL